MQKLMNSLLPLKSKPPWVSSQYLSRLSLPLSPSPSLGQEGSGKSYLHTLSFPLPICSTHGYLPSTPSLPPHIHLFLMRSPIKKPKQFLSLSTYCGAHRLPTMLKEEEL
jgi:hypothetical protein